MLERFKNRPLSHSQLSSFEYSPEQWYQSYVLNQRSPATPEMLIGNVIGDAIGTPDSPIAELNPPGVKEYELRAEFDGISMVGYCDHWCADKLELNENKTSNNRKRWTKGKTDQHDQLTMYAMLLNLQDDIQPEDITMYLNFIPVDIVGVEYVANQNWKQFQTKRNTEDIKKYQEKVMQLLTLMDEYATKRSLDTPARIPPVFR